MYNRAHKPNSGNFDSSPRNRVVHRGHIYYAFKTTGNVPEIGAEITAGRPCIIVSNEKFCESSGAVMAVYLTSAPKEDLDTHVYIQNSDINSTALCEQVVTINKSRLGNHIGKVSEHEMELIDKAIVNALGIDVGSSDIPKELVELRIERDTYKKMYDSLVNRITKK